MHPLFVARLFTIAKTGKQPKCPLTDEWMKKMWYTHTKQLFAVKNNEIMAFTATWMALEIVILSKVSQKEKDRGFPGGPVVKNLPAEAGDIGFDPWSRKISHATGQLLSLCAWSLCSATREPTAMRSSHTTTKSSPPRRNQRKQQRPSAA